MGFGDDKAQLLEELEDNTGHMSSENYAHLGKLLAAVLMVAGETVEVLPEEPLYEVATD